MKNVFNAQKNFLQSKQSRRRLLFSFSSIWRYNFVLNFTHVKSWGLGWGSPSLQNDVESPDTGSVQSQPTQVSDTNFSVRAAAAVETGPTHVSRDPAPPPHVVDWPSDNKIDPDNNKISTIRMATINLQSINRKASFVHDIISENNLSFLSATELWHTTSLDIPLLRAVPQGFRVFDQPRPVDPSPTRAPRTNHGGVAIFYSDRFSGKRLNLGFSPTTFELLACSLRLSSIIYTQVVIYRPGSEQVTDRFFDEITTLLEIVATFQSQVVISGDFNIHVDDPNDRQGHHLLEILDSFDMVQDITGSTHKGDHTLDLVITRRNSPPAGYRVDPPVYSDHSLVLCAFPPMNFAVHHKTKNVRFWKHLDRD